MIAKLIFVGLALLTLGACRHNPNRADRIDTDLKKSQALNADESIGIKGGNLVVQKKVQMNEELRRLQYEVFEMEDRVFGNRKYGAKGLYGALKACREEIVSKKLGGDGKLTWTEPADRVTDREEEFNVGVDEKDKIVAVSEEFLKDRIARFQKYKQILLKRQDEYEEKLEICDADLKARKESRADAAAGENK